MRQGFPKHLNPFKCGFHVFATFNKFTPKHPDPGISKSLVQLKFCIFESLIFELFHSMLSPWDFHLSNRAPLIHFTSCHIITFNVGPSPAYLDIYLFIFLDIKKPKKSHFIITHIFGLLDSTSSSIKHIVSSATSNRMYLVHYITTPCCMLHQWDISMPNHPTNWSTHHINIPT